MRGDVPVGRRARRDKEIDLEKALEDAEFKKSLLNVASMQNSKKQSSHENRIYVCSGGHILRGYKNERKSEDGKTNVNYVLFLDKIDKQIAHLIIIGIGSKPFSINSDGAVENIALIFGSYIKQELAKHKYNEGQINNFLDTLSR